MVDVLKRSQSLPSLWKMATRDRLHSEKYQAEKVGENELHFLSIIAHE